MILLDLFVINVKTRLEWIQSKLEFENWEEFREFNHKRGLGRIALTACILGIMWGIHFISAMVLLFVLFHLSQSSLLLSPSLSLSSLTSSSSSSSLYLPPIPMIILSMLSSQSTNEEEIQQQTQQQQQEEQEQEQGQQQLILLRWIIIKLLLLHLCVWCIYIVMTCTFHLCEFFTTVIYNPLVVSYDTFIVNHSKAYTFIILSSSIEFWIRVGLLMACYFYYATTTTTVTATATTTTTTTTEATNNNSSNHTNDTHSNLPSFFWLHYYYQFCTIITIVGWTLALLSQIIRSLAMITCAESFNHIIQTSKKQNHILITHGIYKYLRHPSYVGFYYWSIGMQLILNNTIHTIIATILSWIFFRRRIPFEEESLCHHFPNEYPQYMERTYSGIPLIYGTKYILPPTTIASSSTSSSRSSRRTSSGSNDHDDHHHHHNGKEHTS